MAVMGAINNFGNIQKTFHITRHGKPLCWYLAAQRVRPNSAAYSASKHGLWGLSQVTALEGREYGVTCCTLHPGNILVERRSQSGKREDDEPMLSVEEISQVAVLMATLPPHVEMLEAIVLPSKQLYVGRG